MLSLIRDLPRGSRYVTLIRWRQENGEAAEDEDEDEEQPSEERRAQEERMEMRNWSSLDYELQAIQVNLLQDLLRFIPQWKKTPDAPETVGPPHWKRKQKQKTQDANPGPRTESRPATVLDAMKAMGYDPAG